MLLNRFFSLLKAAYQLSYQGLYLNKRRYQNELQEHIQTASDEVGKVFHRPLYNRILFYGLRGNVCNICFTTLRGFPPSEKESKAAFYLGAATAVFDDLFDQHDYTAEEALGNLVEGKYRTNAVAERLSKKFYDLIMENLEDNQIFLDCLRKITEIQEDSKQQKNSKLNQEEIRHVTYEKGAYSVALFRSVLSHPYKTKEDEAIYTLGAIMQVMDDVFDVKVDFNDQIATLATTAQNIKQLSTEYDQLVKKCFQQFAQLGYSEKNTKQFLHQFSLIMSQGKVCCEHLENIQEKYNGDFDPKKYSKRELVCDMDLMSNKWKSLKYSLRMEE